MTTSTLVTTSDVDTTPHRYAALDRLQTAYRVEEIAGRVYTRYQEALTTNNAMDFDDLLMRSALLFRDNLAVRVKYQQKWQYLLVDEFQDISEGRARLLHALKAQHEDARIFAVGDDWQSIYRFAHFVLRLIKYN